MELLRVLTLIYAAVLVLALAASLIAILLYLRKTSRALGAARAALAEARRESLALQEHLSPLEGLSREAADEFKAAEAWVGQADEALAALLERLGLGALTH